MKTETALKFLGKETSRVFRSREPLTTQLKMDLLTTLGDLEKVMKGAFHSDLLFKDADVEQIKLMFPNGCRLFKVEKQEDWYRIGHFFSNLRDACAHAKLSPTDLSIFNFCFKDLDNEPKFNTQVAYAKRRMLTVAGLIFLVLNFLRAESIKMLTKKSSLFAIVACGSNVDDDGTKFVEKISKVNLELPIRKNEGETIFGSLLGDYFKDGTGEFSLKFGSPKYPLFHVNGYADDNKVIIYKKSLTSIYYLDDYQIDIIYKEGFIELANKLPTLTLVDVLKVYGFRVFDKDAYNSLVSKWELIKKLNYPKFYVDKSIRTLTLPETNADDRIVNKLINYSLSYVFLTIEQVLYDLYSDNSTDYSKIGSLLHKAGLPVNLVNDVTVLRNYVMHSSLFGTYYECGDVVYKYSFEYTTNTLVKLLRFFKENNNTCYELMRKVIDEYYTGSLLKLKYNKSIKASVQFVKEYPYYNKPELRGGNLLVEHSCYDTHSLDTLKEICGGVKSMIEVISPRFEDTLYFVYNDDILDKINDFCKINKCQYRVVDGPLMIRVNIE